MFYFETITKSPAVLRNNIDIQLPFTHLPQRVTSYKYIFISQSGYQHWIGQDTKHFHHHKDPLHLPFIFITSCFHPLLNI